MKELTLTYFAREQVEYNEMVRFDEKAFVFKLMTVFDTKL